MVMSILKFTIFWVMLGAHLAIAQTIATGRVARR